MEPFLKNLAQQVYTTHLQLDKLIFIFPNRRAALYFKKYLGETISRPTFAPTLITIEDFIASFTSLKVPDKLELIYRLHKTYNEVINTASGKEPFDAFYFWGDLLLRDFDELDKYLIDARQLFRDLRNQKELDSSFDYLTKEQKNFLLGFWGGFEEQLTKNKKNFIDLWTQLFTLYQTFRNQLEENGLAYEGMVHRQVAESIASGTGKYNPASIKFVGFNALTLAEEKILSHFASQGSELIWDADAYYVNNKSQEAGEFFRAYQKHAVLGKTFPADFPSHFLQKKSIRVLGAPQPVGQAQLMGQILNEELEKGMMPEDTLIVLPDEKLLMPVLYAMPRQVDKLNVTMGFSLSNTSLFNLLELLLELQVGKRKDYFNHRQVLGLLSHPQVIAADPAAANAKRKEILKHNWINVPQHFLATAIPLHQLIFTDIENGLLSYLTNILTEMGSFESLTNLDKEYGFQLIKLINRIKEIMGNPPMTGKPGDKEYIKSIKSFLQLLRQVVRLQKIPFSGEPLKGLQVMGVLETRNIDFKNVFILSLNEGTFPTSGSKGSYIPFNIRKAYGLPVAEHQDAIYAYLFYRVLQRAEKVFLFYNTETDPLGQGEKSRYLQQLLFESGIPMDAGILHNPVAPTPIKPIVIRKNETVMAALAKLNAGGSRFQGISPSALNAYLECKLRFYFRYVARLHEPNEVEDEMDARVLGNFLHLVMERFYKNLAAAKQSNLVGPDDFIHGEKMVDQLLDEVFIDTYHLDANAKVEYQGQSVVVQQMVKNFALQIFEQDKKMAPFTMESIEQEGLSFTVPIKVSPGVAVIGGKIDRVDRKGNVVRIVDYKTGKDTLNFSGIASLFEKTGKRNKAAFQTLLYALLYEANHALAPEDQLIPGLINRNNLFNEAGDFGLQTNKKSVGDVRQLLPEFKTHLTQLLEELFNPEEVFDQTAIQSNCKLCPYKDICYR